jgi:hypothetical protein
MVPLARAVNKIIADEVLAGVVVLRLNLVL